MTKRYFFGGPDLLRNEMSFWAVLFREIVDMEGQLTRGSCLEHESVGKDRFVWV